MHALFGLPPQTFNGCYEDFLKLIHEEDRRENSRRIRAGDSHPHRHGYRVSDHLAIGRERAYRQDPFKSARRRKRKIERIVGVAWDITERRETELALEKERNLLTTLMENLPQHIYFKDLDSRFIAVSRALANWHGRNDPSEIIGKTDQDLVFPRTRRGRPGGRT